MKKFRLANPASMNSFNSNISNIYCSAIFLLMIFSSKCLLNISSCASYQISRKVLCSQASIKDYLKAWTLMVFYPTFPKLFQWLWRTKCYKILLFAILPVFNCFVRESSYRRWWVRKSSFLLTSYSHISLVGLRYLVEYDFSFYRRVSLMAEFGFR